MANMRLITDVWSDDGTVTATSEAGLMTADKLQNSQPSDVWRSTTATAQTITTNLGTLRPVSMFYLGNHNLDAAASIQVDYATDVGFTNILRTETITRGTLAEGLGQGGLGTSGLGGYSATGWLHPFTVSWFNSVLVQYCRVIITNTANPNGYIQTGRLIFGRYWEPPYNLMFDYSIMWAEDTAQRRTRGGALRSDNKEPYRVAQGALQAMGQVDEITLLALMRVRGKRKDVLFSAYPEVGGDLEANHTILGRFTTYDPISRLESGRRWNFTLEESL